MANDKVISVEPKNYDLEFLPTSNQAIKRCLKCGSVFVNPSECEACGLKFKPHILGEPLGPKSFFSLKENYLENQSFFKRKDPQRYKDFRKKLILRFRSLLETLEHSFEDLDAWNIFNFELLELTRYLSSVEENKYLLNRILLEKRDHPLFFDINKIVQEGSPKKIEEKIPYPFKRTLYFSVFLTFLVLASLLLNKLYFL